MAWQIYFWIFICLAASRDIIVTGKIFFGQKTELDKSLSVLISIPFTIVKIPLYVYIIKYIL